jgi:AraC-like DNA-binding protein
MKIAAIHLSNYIEYAQVRGIPVNELKKLIKSLPPDLSNETAQIDVKDFYRVLEFINSELEDEDWGIKAGNFLAMRLLGLIYRISLHTKTIEEALHYLQSYLNATLPLITAQTDILKNLVTITLNIENNAEVVNRVILENTLTIIAREITIMSNGEVPIRLGTPFYKSFYPDGWQQDSAFTIYFQPGILKAALRPGNQWHLDVLIPGFLKLIEQLKPGEGFSKKVKVTMLSMSDPQLPDIQSISNALCLTPRTLQRRLGEENITFRKLSEELKKQVCTHLLQHESYTVSALSHVLGYSEPASFLHAFKKWFGDSPVKMRGRWRSEV